MRAAEKIDNQAKQDEMRKDDDLAKEHENYCKFTAAFPQAAVETYFMVLEQRVIRLMALHMDKSQATDDTIKMRCVY